MLIVTLLLGALSVLHNMGQVIQIGVAKSQVEDLTIIDEYHTMYVRVVRTVYYYVIRVCVLDVERPFSPRRHPDHPVLMFMPILHPVLNSQRYQTKLCCVFTKSRHSTAADR